MSYYTYSSKEVDKKLNEIQYGTEAAAMIARLEAEVAELRAKLEATEKQLQQLAMETAQEKAD